MCDDFESSIHFPPNNEAQDSYIDICMAYVFSGKDVPTTITKNLFKTSLETAVLNSYFVFNQKL